MIRNPRNSRSALTVKDASGGACGGFRRPEIRQTPVGQFSVDLGWWWRQRRENTQPQGNLGFLNLGFLTASYEGENSTSRSGTLGLQKEKKKTHLKTTWL